MAPSLSAQTVAHASIETKIRCSMLSLAMVDALGGPVEFKRRFSFPLIDKMIPNKTFNLGPGTWTDDTSMALCLAKSITSLGAFNETDQLDRYLAWYHDGEFSCIGRCFDIGNTIRAALDHWAKNPRDDEFSKLRVLDGMKMKFRQPQYRGNGSLMRVLPVGLAFHHSEATAAQLARRSSETTHPESMCAEACEIYTRAIVRIITTATTPSGEKQYSKFDLLRDLTETFGIEDKALRASLCLPHSIPPEVVDIEAEYRLHHPLFSFTPQHLNNAYPLNLLPSSADLPSSGYVLHTLIAALYAFFTTSTFEDGAILAVNMGDDADTVGAVYGGLAGCWYGQDDFWNDKGKEWLAALQGQDILRGIIDDLTRFAPSSSNINDSS